MKKDIHPQYYKDATVKCSCGHIFRVGSTVRQMHTEVCSFCHPFYTGGKKLIDTAGQIEKFKARMAKAKSKKQ